MSKHLRRQADDLHEVLLAQLAGNGSEDPRPAWVALVVDDHGRILVEGDRGPVLSALRLLRPHDHRPHDLALLDLALGRGGLDRADDDVAYARIAAVRAAHDADAQTLACSRVVRDPDPCLLRSE